MQKNTVLFVVFSTVFLIAWYVFFQPAPQQVQTQYQTETTLQQTTNKEQSISQEQNNIATISNDAQS